MLLFVYGTFGAGSSADPIAPGCHSFLCQVWKRDLPWAPAVTGFSGAWCGFSGAENMCNNDDFFPPAGVVIGLQ